VILFTGSIGVGVTGYQQASRDQMDGPDPSHFEMTQGYLSRR
jgi:hypothetical protein